MSGTSNVGNSQVYEAGDQRNIPQDEIRQQQKDKRFDEGQKHSHKFNDAKDERSIANKLEREGQHKEKNKDSEQTQQLKKDPTLPAKAHGNEPSKGAKIDAQIQAEEEEMLRKKDAKK